MKKKYANNPRAAEARALHLQHQIQLMNDELAEIATVLRDSSESFNWTLRGLKAFGVEPLTVSAFG